MRSRDLLLHRAWRQRVFLAAALGACAHPSTAPKPAIVKVYSDPPTSVAATPSVQTPSVPATSAQAPTADAAVAGPLPKLQSSASALTDAPARRISSLVAPAGSSIADVAQQMGKAFNLNVSVDPDVRGTIAASLHDVTLDEALREIVRRNGYAYQLQGRTLRISPARLTTRIFTLDYVALSRFGTANTVIQRRLSSTTNSATPTVGTAPGLTTSAPGSGLTGIPGGDVIAATNVSDLWTELRVTLMGLLGRGVVAARAGANAAAPNTPVTTGQNQGGGNTLGGAFSTTWADGTSLTLSPASGLITVSATDDQLADVEAYINAFKSSVLRQVLIEAKIVEVQLTKSLQYGIDWSVVTKSGSKVFTMASSPTTSTTGQTGNITFSLPGGATQINAVLNALSSQGDVNVLSNARTSALNNQRAVFDVTTDEVFFADVRQPLLSPTGGVVGFNDQVTAQTISVGVVLDVLPQISSDNVLTMNIRPVVTSLDRVETFTAADGTTARFPVTSRREGDTMARVRNGETIIIGGLLQTQRNRTVSGIPILRDLPLIGRIFTHIDDEEKRVELVVFLTPTVITGQPEAGR